LERKRKPQIQRKATQSKIGMIRKKKEASNSKERSMQLHTNYLEKRKGIQSPLARVSFRKGLLM